MSKTNIQEINKRNWTLDFYSYILLHRLYVFKVRLKIEIGVSKFPFLFFTEIEKLEWDTFKFDLNEWKVETNNHVYFIQISSPSCSAKVRVMRLKPVVCSILKCLGKMHPIYSELKLR